MWDRSQDGSKASGRADDAEASRLIGAGAESLPPIADADAFGAAFDRFAGARVVLLGEATHGTSEFYRARAALTLDKLRHGNRQTVVVQHVV